MGTMDRRKFVTALICGAGAGLALPPVAAHALPLGPEETGKLAERLADDVQRAKSRWFTDGRDGAAGSAGGIADAVSAVGAGSDDGRWRT